MLKRIETHVYIIINVQNRDKFIRFVLFGVDKLNVLFDVDRLGDVQFDGIEYICLGYKKKESYVDCYYISYGMLYERASVNSFAFSDYLVNNSDYSLHQ